MKYKFLTMVLCLSVLSLTACGNDTETVSKNDTVTETMETEKTTEAEVQTESETTEQTVIVEQQTESETVEDTVTEPEPTEEEVPTQQTIIVKEMNQTMYAKSAVNVRKGDSTDYEKIGSLSFNQQVQVTGQSEATGWYRIEFNGEVGFVSKNYLSTEKTVVTQSQNQNNNGNNNNGGSSNNNNNNGNTGGGTSSNEGEGDEPADWEAPEDYNPGPAEGEYARPPMEADPWSGLVTDIELNDPDAP